MENYEFETLVGFTIKNKLKYISNEIVIKYILKNETGTVMVMAVDFGKIYNPEPSNYSTFILVLEGKAEIVVDEVPTFLQNDDAMIIPGDTIYTVEANERFKMLYIILNNKI